MNNKTLQINYKEYLSITELPEPDLQLLMKARGAVLQGYAPYSGFRVGAAVLLRNGNIITGNNQENAAYPSGICAERTAMFYAASQHPDSPITAVAVSSFNNGSGGISKPCGACRQVMAEYEDLGGLPLRLILDGNDKIIILHGIDCLLPFRFRKEDLK